MSDIMSVVEQGSFDKTCLKAMLDFYNKEIEQISTIPGLSSFDTQKLTNKWDIL